MRIESDIKLDFKDVLIRPKRSTLRSRANVSVERTFIMKHSKQVWTGVPMMAANMDTVGTFEVALVLAKRKVMTAIHKYYTVEQWAEFIASNPADGLRDFVIPSVGILPEDIEKLQKILAMCDFPMFCIDVANGYSQGFVEKLRELRLKFPSKTIMAGNVVTGEMTEELILSGADVVKVGIGPGSVCTTRMKTGVGYPQLSAVIECADAAHGLGGLIISDGGCACAGDIAKGFGAGADFVMLGGMLAGHDEGGGVVIEENGRRFKIFYGMSSSTAMEKYAGGVADYRSTEGKTVRVPCRGPIDDTVRDMMGGLRSACTYIGAASLKEVSKRTTFVRVTQQLNQSFQGDNAYSKELPLE